MDKINECVTNCDTPRYAPSSVTQDQMARTLQLLEEIIDKPDRIRLLCAILFTTILITQYNSVIVQRESVVIAESAGAKFEPIDDATTFFILSEGESVVMAAVNEGRARVGRLDGKQGWVKSREVEPLLRIYKVGI